VFVSVGGGGTIGWPGRAHVAVVRGDPTTVFLAESADVLGRVLGLRLIAATPPEFFSEGARDEIRQALLEERWADALTLWMTASDQIVDVYPDEEVWSEDQFELERVSVDIRLSAIFRDPRPS
jgi:hypothetical protein